MTLRKGLTYSNGAPVKASDFRYSIQRAIKLPWGGKSFYTGYIAGATAYDTGKAKTISGITGRRRDRQDHDQADQALRRVPQRARVPVVGARADRYADQEPVEQPAARASVRTSSRTSSRTRASSPMPNPKWASFKIPGIPAGQGHGQGDDRDEHQRGGRVGAQQHRRRLRLGRPAPAGAAQQQAEQQTRAASRSVPTASTYYFFLNTDDEAVQQPEGARGGQLRARPSRAVAAQQRQLRRRRATSCRPASSVTRPARARTATRTRRRTWPRPRQLIQQSGLAGAPVTVWGQHARSADRRSSTYYTAGAQQHRAQGEAEDHRRRRSTSRRSGT